MPLPGVKIRIRRFLRRQHGAVLPLTAVYLLVSVGFLALAIDLGHIFLVQAELQRVADAAALSGALRLMTPSSGPISGVMPASVDCARAVTMALEVGPSNKTDGRLTPRTNLTINLGTWSGGLFTATGCANPSQVNAVQAVARLTADIFFGTLLTGKNTIDLSASATALTGTVGGLPPGYRTLPLAVDADKLPSEGQRLIIHLNPTPGDDGCWHTFFWQNPSANLIRDIINGEVEVPQIRVGDYIKVKEGVAASDLQTLGRQLSNHGGTWDVVLPVIPPDSHTGWAEVLGFAAVRLTLVEDNGSDKRVEVLTLNNKLAPTTLPGRGTYFGLAAGAPRLVN
ncbi:MAG: pilus assembly protein TadG-related protein [Desulfobaccales bacterium]